MPRLDLPPVAPTGTAQDLMRIVINAHEGPADGELLARKPGLHRLLLEVPCASLGALFGGLLRLLPADWVLARHDRAFARLCRGAGTPFDPHSAALERARELVRRVEAASGKRAALISLSVHSPDMARHRHLNFELVRHALLALRRLRGGPCRPRILGAVDAFALDTFSVPEEAFYAGFMSGAHLGLDRLSLGRNPVRSALLRRCSWERLGHRLMREIRGGEVEMALAGGIAPTARLLYVVREWLWAHRRQSPLRRDPGRVRARLEDAGALTGGARRSAWRALEAWAMSALARAPAGQEPPSRSGVLTPEATRILELCLEALGLDPDGDAIPALSRELSRQTPYRPRFFHALAGRVLKKGTPAVLLPVVYRPEPELPVEIKDAWAVERAPCGGLRVRVSSSPAREWECGASELAVRFGEENFP